MYASTLRKSSLSAMDERNASEASLSGNLTKMSILLKNKNIYKSADHLMSMTPAPKHIDTSSRLFYESKRQTPSVFGVSSSSLSSMEKRLNGGGNTRSFENLTETMPIKTSSLEHNEFMVNKLIPHDFFYLLHPNSSNSKTRKRND